MSTLYLRESRHGDWDRIDAATPEDTDFAADVLSDLINIECQTSIWQVDDRDTADVDLLSAALHQKLTKRLSDMTFRFISERQLKQLGLTKRQTQGESLDKSLNVSGKHWIVETPTIRHAIILAKALKTQEPKFYSQESVMKNFAKSIAEKRIKTSTISPELWNILIDKGFINIST
jgi:hypothetical protein